MPKAVLITLIAFCLILASCVTPKTGPPPVSKVQERDFDFYIRQGSLCLGRAEYREAREYLDKAISLNPKSERAYNLRGIASLNPDSAAPNYSLGTLLLLQGRREEGARYLAH